MPFWELTFWQLLALVQHELLLFAGIFFLIGAVDDLAVDFTWLWLKLTGRVGTAKFDREEISQAQLTGDVAVFIPAWSEAEVIGDTIRHALKVWPQSDLRLYVGCYPNDPATISAVMEAMPGDQRLRLVINDRPGPTTKADCLNRLYRALQDDEQRLGRKAHMVVFHDAEDMVDQAGLVLLDRAIGRSSSKAAFAQLPVLPMPQHDSRWIGSHYCEEFAESHGKAMVVRGALGAALPAAGVGCAVERHALDRLAEGRSDQLPFAADSLTEDYELGMGVAAQGGRSRFVRARSAEGDLIATRSYFPARLDHVVTQKTRWVHGIALQGWDRLGWNSNIVEGWMRLRDRRGPFSSIVLIVGYLLLVLSGFITAASQMGYGTPIELSVFAKTLLWANLIAFGWRVIMRFALTTREYGWVEGVRSVLRIPIANIIAIMAGGRAVLAYGRTLMGAAIVWDKTPHFSHPTRVPEPVEKAEARAPQATALSGRPA
ncbi:MAG: glycosyl transferase family protein [Erythrobacter sp.]